MAKQIEMAELSKHTTKGDIWIAVNGKVFDVTKYIEEHPGGEEQILEYGGMDATDAFEDVGHSAGARDILMKYEIGELVGWESSSRKPRDPKEEKDGVGIARILVPIVFMAVIAFVAQKFV
eukprot:CAMPEP_0181314522 /NCGR_PEP_ID=MMETSP1101-20121128/14867_1 /TAXON_ID=46948 /ORGANISM="Rhodomonas abbreviata, Strain Caron Lab Isolate" /LENGTH=120 /DNA_ID=CAMNT_0023421629 /DNA_START=77 /DNA_END=439 /DNA_ORIENTATION=-